MEGIYIDRILLGRKVELHLLKTLHLDRGHLDSPASYSPRLRSPQGKDQSKRKIICGTPINMGSNCITGRSFPHTTNTRTRMASSGKTFCSKWVITVMVIAVIMGSTADAGSGSISCGDAVSTLVPCESFVLGSSLPPPSAECCSSAQKLESMADTTEKRRALCRCFEQVSPSFGVKPDRVKSLPVYCKLKITLPGDPHFDCSQYTISPSLPLSLSRSSSLSHYLAPKTFCLCDMQDPMKQRESENGSHGVGSLSEQQCEKNIPESEDLTLKGLHPHIRIKRSSCNF